MSKPETLQDLFDLMVANDPYTLDVLGILIFSHFWTLVGAHPLEQAPGPPTNLTF